MGGGRKARGHARAGGGGGAGSGHSVPCMLAGCLILWRSRCGCCGFVCGCGGAAAGMLCASRIVAQLMVPVLCREFCAACATARVSSTPGGVGSSSSDPRRRVSIELGLCCRQASINAAVSACCAQCGCALRRCRPARPALCHPHRSCLLAGRCTPQPSGEARRLASRHGQARKYADCGVVSAAPRSWMRHQSPAAVAGRKGRCSLFAATLGKAVPSVHEHAAAFRHHVAPA